MPLLAMKARLMSICPLAEESHKACFSPIHSRLGSNFAFAVGGGVQADGTEGSSDASFQINATQSGNLLTVEVMEDVVFWLGSEPDDNQG